MSSKMANNGPHAAGIFADMTVDGPEIGTLVLIVDRAKNLPNRKTMGKQNPYCAARLGKEARKTETDKRGGQTPRWDQELRFTVHDSPDYYTLKVSVFSEDKRTDLIGEAYVSLNDVVVPGGGKMDQWQGLNCKGKYAGEIRIEMTYYDTREKPDKQHEAGMSVAEELKQQYGSLNAKVKRRPLPVNPNAPATQPVVIPERALPGRAKHGPRDYSTPSRATSLPPEGPKTFNYPHSQTTLFGQKPVAAQPQSAGPTPVALEPQRVLSDYGEYDPNLGPELYSTSPTPAQPDFLPELGPSRRQRSPLHPQPNYAQRQLPPQQHARPPTLQHANSAPAVPESHVYEDGSQLRTDYPDAIPDLDHQYQQVRQRRNDVPPGWENEYGSPQAGRQPYVEDDFETSPPPPPPPMHSHSSPAVPHYNSPHGQAYPPATRYGTTPPARRQDYVPNSSPLQSIERNYAPQQTPPSLQVGHPRRGQSFDEYGGSPYQASYGSTPNLISPQQTPPPGRTPPHGRQHPGRHSMADLYSTPSRPHPLSQEVSRARSPNPYAQGASRSRSPNPYGQESMEPSPYQSGYRGRESAPLAIPRAASPQPPVQRTPDSRPKSSYSIQHPVRAFESADGSPLSTSQLGSSRALPRKSVSPRPSMSEGSRSAMPFGPDDFGANGASQPQGGTSPTRNGPIVGWHGQEIDPSDHLPVEAWAPEPEPKVPNRTYGLGRDRDFGPRGQGIMTTGGRMSKDTMINVRPRQQSAPPEPVPEPQPSKIRARLVKKSAPSSPMEPLRDHANFNAVPNPYEQQSYSHRFRDRSPGPIDDRMTYENAYGPPSIPPKVPLQQPDYGPDALSRELSTIDIGTGRRQAPASFQPVRSHRDRNSYY